MGENDKRRFSVTLTPIFVKALDSLVKEGLYIDNQDMIRHAMRQLFEYHGVKPFALKKVKLGE